MNFEDGLARFHELWEHPERVSRPKLPSIESDSPSAEDLERAVKLVEGEDRMPPEALQRFADAMD